MYATTTSGNRTPGSIPCHGCGRNADVGVMRVTIPAQASPNTDRRRRSGRLHAIGRGDWDWECGWMPPTRTGQHPSEFAWMRRCVCRSPRRPRFETGERGRVLAVLCVTSRGPDYRVTLSSTRLTVAGRRCRFLRKSATHVLVLDTAHGPRFWIRGLPRSWCFGATGPAKRGTLSVNERQLAEAPLPERSGRRNSSAHPLRRCGPMCSPAEATMS
jgi:hypothetical protein